LFKAIESYVFMKNTILLDRIDYSNIMACKGDPSAFFFQSGMSIDADGAFRAYHPDDEKGLDHLANAGRPGNWWGLVTDNGSPGGKPLIQRFRDPAPGYYISSTSLADSFRELNDPLRYVDSETIPFIVLPANKRFGARLGDLCIVYNPVMDEYCGGVFADLGPRNKIGEASIAMAKKLGIPSSPKTGGIAHGIVYLVFPRSSHGWPLSNDEIQQYSRDMFWNWGGTSRLEEVFQLQHVA